ncbi:MAG: WYL domain-containing protein [Verrucomicrobiales bacterium]|nr:WYL domain-containing protein [Verrucomicrobiales bacterium]
MANSSNQLRSRPPLQRMMFIHERLKQGEFPNCQGLSRQLELGCAKTVMRDIAFMRDRMALPVEYDAQRKGYFYSSSVEHFPAVQVSEAELFAILVAQKALVHYQGTPFHEPLKTAFEKLAGCLDPQAVVRLDDLGQAMAIRMSGPEDLDPQVFQAVSRAVQQQRLLKFQYRKHANRTWQRRTLQPYQLVCANHRWYVLGHDTARRALRAFVVGRIREPQVQDERFARPRNFRVDDYLKGSFGIYKGRGDFEVVIDLDRWAADLVRGRKWHASQVTKDLPGGELRIGFRLSSIEEIEPWVLGWGAHATVVRPKALVDRVRAAAAGMLKRYVTTRGTDEDGGQVELGLDGNGE